MEGGLNSQRMARLDIFVVTEAWEVLFGGATTQSFLKEEAFLLGTTTL